MISDLCENRFLPPELSDWMTATLFPPHLLCSFTDKQFLLICLSQSALASHTPPARVGALARTPHTHTPTHTHTRVHTSLSRIDGDRSGGEGSPDYWTTCSEENRGKSIIAAF